MSIKNNYIGHGYPIFFGKLTFSKNQRITLIHNPYHKELVGKELYALKDCYGSYVHFLPVDKTIYDVNREPFCGVNFVIPYTELHMILYGIEPC